MIGLSSYFNKVPLKRIAKGSILLQCTHVSTPSPSGRRLLSNSACQLFMVWEWRKSEGSFSTCCEINRFEKGCNERTRTADLISI